jgi:hypothetical protein
MVETLKTALGTLLLLFQSRSRLQVEILALRQQLIVLRRTAPKRVRLRAVDRLLFVLPESPAVGTRRGFFFQSVVLAALAQRRFRPKGNSAPSPRRGLFLRS